MLKNFFWNILKKLANLNLAIFILFVIAFFSMLGSIIEQKQDLLFYQINYPAKDNNVFLFNWKFITFLGLDHIYEAWWFILILLVFALSLLICTFTNQLPSLKNSRRWKFFHVIDKNKKNSIYDSNFYFKHSFYNSFINVIYSLNNSSFYVFHRGTTIYAYKGLFGRISPVFVHLSIIITLLGSILGIFTGFVSQEMISRGELFHVKNIVKSGLFSFIPRSVLGRINDFTLIYNKDGSIKQFLSDVTILNSQGRMVCNKIISVNSPLRFNSLTFYQTDWNIDGLRVEVENRYIVQKKVTDIDLNGRKCWLSNVALDSYEHYVFLLFDLQDQIYVYNKNTNDIFKVFLNEPFYLDNIKFVVTDILVSTGLYVKTDPGITIVYSGFFIIMLSTVTSYISYTQIWASKSNENISFSGLTNRATLFFEEDVHRINTIYKQYTFLYK